jgi:hypothetical protein
VKMKTTIILIVIFLLLPASSHPGKLEEWAALRGLKKVDPLRGLKGVEVIVEPMKPETERLGLKIDQIKTFVELKLRKAGIRVFTLEEAVKKPGTPNLFVSVNTLIHSELPNLCVFGLLVELNEMVTLSSGAPFHASVWNKYLIGISSINNVRIRDEIGDLIDNFINDYLAANPN